MGGTDDPHRHHVIADEEGGGACRQGKQAGHGGKAAGAVEIPLLDPGRIDGPSGLLHGLLEASQALVRWGAAVGAGDAADVGMTE
ncbi:hypothetical protein D3C76_1367940 [compost metagenome]